VGVRGVGWEGYRKGEEGIPPKRVAPQKKLYRVPYWSFSMCSADENCRHLQLT
jgi:hypothetical protein